MARVFRAVMFVAAPCLTVGAEMKCEKTAKWEASEKHSGPCGQLMDRPDNKGRCAENNFYLGGSPLCNDHTDQAACESVSGEFSTPFDSSKKKCIWLEKFDGDASRKAGCELSKQCHLIGEHCQETDEYEATKKAWNKGRGLDDCSARVAYGCATNDGRRAKGGHCDHNDETACLAVEKTDYSDEPCGTGTCSGGGSYGRPCAESKYRHECGGENCTFKSQCCQWIEGPPEDFENACLNGPKGHEATITGLCETKEEKQKEQKDYEKCMSTCPTVYTTKWPEGFGKGEDKDKEVKAIEDNKDVKESIKCLCEKCGTFKELQDWALSDRNCKAAGTKVASGGRSPVLALSVLLALGMAPLA